MQTVEPQPVRAPRSGLALLNAAPSITDADLHWLDGIRWSPEIRAGASAIGIECGSNGERTPPSQLGMVEFVPFLVWAAEKCSTKGGGVRDWFGRARRALEAQQSFLVAGEFWNGTLGEELSNANLAASTATTVTSSAQTAQDGLAAIDSALTRRLLNRPGMIHCRPEMVTLWAEWLRFESGTVLSPGGHLIVADAGYTGDGPRSVPEGAVNAADGTSQWVYGTDLVYVRLGKVETLPSDTDTIAEGVDRLVNNQTVWAERMAAIQWDEHAHLAAEISEPALT